MIKISGFTMVRNAGSLYFPIKESILSILPVVDEFIVALGNCSDDDTTLASIESIQSTKIKIFPRTWSVDSYVDGRIFSEETNFALAQCSGDWCFYLQADEVVHENDLPVIRRICERYSADKGVDGFLFKYYHFWGDYDHYLPFHGWYKNEIRIIRNHGGIYSFKDAQSFRKSENEKLNVIPIEAHIYHYGWVRPPEKMQQKGKVQNSIHHGVEKAAEIYKLQPDEFDYGPLGAVPVFKNTHPTVMGDLIKKLNWKTKLNYSKKGNITRPKAKHEKFKYRLITLLENLLNGGENFFGYSNWNIVKKKK